MPGEMADGLLFTEILNKHEETARGKRFIEYFVLLSKDLYKYCTSLFLTMFRQEWKKYNYFLRRTRSHSTRFQSTGTFQRKCE